MFAALGIMVTSKLSHSLCRSACKLVIELFPSPLQELNCGDGALGWHALMTEMYFVYGAPFIMKTSPVADDIHHQTVSDLKPMVFVP
jgi:hypothetical protein